MQVGPTEYVPLADVRQGTVLELIPLEVFPLIEAFRTTRAGRFPQHCEFKRSFGKSGRDLGQFQSPWGLAIGKDGVLICAEHQNHR